MRLQSVSLLCCSGLVGAQISAARRTAFVQTEEFLNYTLGYMRSKNLTTFSMCKDAKVWDDQGNGFVPCPFPSHGEGTLADPGIACTLGVNAQARTGRIILAAICAPVCLYTIVVTIRIISERAQGHRKKSAAFAKAPLYRLPFNPIERIFFYNVLLQLANILYVVDPDGLEGMLPFYVSLFFSQLGLFVILQILFLFTNAVISSTNMGTATSRRSAGGMRETNAWYRARMLATAMNLFFNLVLPIFVQSEYMVEPDGLLTPFFGDSGIGNFLGWYNGQFRAIRMLANFFGVNAYMGMCNLYLWRLRRLMVFGIKRKEKQNLSREELKKDKNIELLLRLAKQQFWVSVLVLSGTAFWFTGIFTLDQTVRLYIPPCTASGVIFSDFMLLFCRVPAGPIILMISGLKYATRRKGAKVQSTSHISSSATSKASSAKSVSASSVSTEGSCATDVHTSSSEATVSYSSNVTSLDDHTTRSSDA